jgi:hypothetical protein
MNRHLVKIIQDPEGLKSMKFVDGGVRQSASYTWYRGDSCNFGPTSEHLSYWRGYSDYFVGSLSPAKPLINQDTRITAFGSCFAANISHWLSLRKYHVLSKNNTSKAYIVRSGEGFVNTYAILQQFQWAFEGKTPTVELWHGYDANAYGYDETVRQQTLQLFNQTDVFILTFGLSEIWYDKPSGEVFWRAIPRDKFDPNRHNFRTVSPEENYTNIRAVLDIIRRYRPKATVIATLSPVPLVASFRNLPCPVSNSFSKASLRCALDRVLSEQSEPNNFHYWPSYEIVLDGFQNRWEKDLRHVKKPILAFIMQLFEHHWCEGGVDSEELSRALFNAKAADGTVRKSIARQLKAAANSKERTALVTSLEATGKLDHGIIRTIKESYC